MVISKALGTYKMKDATMYLTEAMLVIENKDAAPKYQFRVVVPLSSILETKRTRHLLKITQKNGETIKLNFLNGSKAKLFYNYLCSNHPLEYDDTKCLFCGEKLQGEYCTACGQQRVEIVQEEKPQTHKCWNCGAEYETKVDFCASCGANQNTNKTLIRLAAEIGKKDIIDVCPRCHSRNIKLYRKGYNYKIGFWGAIFGVRGAGYAGGFDANKTCCRCMDCGKDWETDYDYRLIDGK